MIRGEVWPAVLDPVRGSEQAGTRPVLVIQGDPLNAFLRTVLVVPFTTNRRWGRFPFCVPISAGDGGLTSDSIALYHQTRVVDSSRLIRRLGVVADTTITGVEEALRLALGM
jgi:mRNA interferase MazF